YAVVANNVKNNSNNFFIHIYLNRFNARLRGWQRIPLNPNTTTVTTAAQWDWKRRALTVPLEAFVRQNFNHDEQLLH
ncbi:hypothetical protein, partial [Vibrio cholerae]|uniref:hypothetical protein n=1 Tax=Vibrio cholerae TaxID=666 RepID=UPI001C8E92DD